MKRIFFIILIFGLNKVCAQAGTTMMQDDSIKLESYANTIAQFSKNSQTDSLKIYIHEIQKKLNKSQQITIKSQRQRNIALSFLLILATILGLISYYYYDKNQQFTKQLLQQKQQLTQQAEELLQTNEMKTKLFAILSHDLRSPLARLLNKLELMNAPNSLRFELNNVQLILDNLLRWSSEQINKRLFNLRTVSLRDIIYSTIAQCKPEAKEKHITVLQQVPDIKVHANENEVLLVLRNLLSNAIKFTQNEGFIWISIEPYAGRNKDMVSVIIKDNGIGIHKRELIKILNFPTSKPGTRGEPGTGIGLSICNRIIQKLGGELIIESKLNKGTTARVLLQTS